MVTAVAGAAAMIGFSAPVAQAEVRSGSGADAAGDAAAPGVDITALKVDYDTAGSAAVAITFAGAPLTGVSAPAAGVQLGPASDSGVCGTPYLLLTSTASSAALSEVTSAGTVSSAAAVSRSVSGTTLTMSVTAPELRNRDLVCAVALTTGNGADQDLLAPKLALAAPAPPPAPPPAPVPTPAPVPAPAPALQKVAKLRVSAIPRTGLRRNRTSSLRVRVANTGTATASAVRLRLGTARGVGVSRSARTVRIGTLRAGKSKSLTVKVRLSRRAARTTRLSLTATGAKGLKATARASLTIGTPRTARPGPTGPDVTKPRPGSMIGRSFWRFQIDGLGGGFSSGFMFVDGRWAYRGFPKQGVPRCTAVTAGVDAKGEETDGCLRYTYNARSGALTVGSESGSYRAGKLVVGDDDGWGELSIPAKGSRFAVKLENSTSQGLCGVTPSCSLIQTSLVMTPDGRFATGKDAAISTPDAIAGSTPPDKQGRYAVTAPGRIVFTYDNGTVTTNTIGIEQDKTGRPDAANEGLLLDGDYYAKDD